jgi:hypothetical protein
VRWSHIIHRPSHTAVQIRREVRLAADSALNAGPEEEANWLGLSGNHLLFPHFDPAATLAVDGLSSIKVAV